MLVELDAVRIIDINIPFVRRLGSASNPQLYKSGCVLVFSGAGDLGFGEAPVFVEPTYSEEFVAQTHGALELFLGVVFAKCANVGLGRAKIDIDKAMTTLRAFKGNNSAKAAIEIGLLDLYARQNCLAPGVVLAQYARNLGFFEIAQRFESSAANLTPAILGQGTSLGLQFDHSARSLELARLERLGYRRIKVKVNESLNFGELTELVRGSSVELSCDANGTLVDPQSAIELARCGFSYLEQPFRAGGVGYVRELHRHLTQESDIKLCLDESLCSIEAVEDAIEFIPFSIAVLKLSRLGGIAPLLAAVQKLEAANIAYYIGGMYDTPILRQLNAILIQALQPAEISDLGPDGDYFNREIEPSIYRDDRGLLQLANASYISCAFVVPERYRGYTSVVKA